MTSVSRGTLSPLSFFEIAEESVERIFLKCTYVWDPLLAAARQAIFANLSWRPLPQIPRNTSGVVQELTLLDLGGEAPVRIEAGAILVGNDIHISPGVTIEATAYITGKNYLGVGTTVRHGAYIRGGVWTGAQVVIGHATEVKNSYLLPRAKAPHFAYVGDSILGQEVNLGAGTKLSNLRMDHAEVRIRQGREKLPTGLKKFGAILGDGVETGCNSVLNPGVLMGPKGVVYPCVSVMGGLYEAGRVLK